MTVSIDNLKILKELSIKGIAFAIERIHTNRFYFGTSEFKILESDLSAEKPEFKELGTQESYVTGLAAADTLLVSGGYDGKLIWWDTEARKQVRSIDAHTKWIRKLRASRDGKFIVSVADDMVGRVWEVQTGKLIHELRAHSELTPHHFPSMLYTCAISFDDRHIATADKTGRIVVWDAERGTIVNELRAPVMYTWDPVQRRHSIGGIRGLAFSPNGGHLAVGGMGKVGNIDHLEGKARIEVFEWKDSKRIVEFQSEQFKGLVNDLEYHTDGDWFVGAGGANDGFLIFFDAKNNRAIKEEKSSVHLHDVLLSTEGDSLVAAGHGRVIVYEMKS